MEAQKTMSQRLEFEKKKAPEIIGGFIVTEGKATGPDDKKAKKLYSDTAKQLGGDDKQLVEIIKKRLKGVYDNFGYAGLEACANAVIEYKNKNLPDVAIMILSESVDFTGKAETLIAKLNLLTSDKTMKTMEYSEAWNDGGRVSNGRCVLAKFLMEKVELGDFDIVLDAANGNSKFGYFMASTIVFSDPNDIADCVKIMASTSMHAAELIAQNFGDNTRALKGLIGLFSDKKGDLYYVITRFCKQNDGKWIEKFMDTLFNSDLDMGKSVKNAIEVAKRNGYAR